MKNMKHAHECVLSLFRLINWDGFAIARWFRLIGHWLSIYLCLCIQRLLNLLCGNVRFAMLCTKCSSRKKNEKKKPNELNNHRVHWDVASFRSNRERESEKRASNTSSKRSYLYWTKHNFVSHTFYFSFYVFIFRFRGRQKKRERDNYENMTVRWSPGVRFYATGYFVRFAVFPLDFFFFVSF